MKTLISAKQIMTLSDEKPTCRHMLIEDGVIIDTFEDMPLIEGENYEHLQYPDQFIYPSFNDSHMHLIGYGAYLSQLRLDGTKSIEIMKEKLQIYTMTCQNHIIIGRSWNQDEFTERRLPTRWDLDEVVSDKPVVLYRACGHIAVVNSAALKYFNISETTEVEGGALDRESGELTGILRENALSLVSTSLEMDVIKKYILAAQKSLNAYGITSVQSDDLIMVTSDRHQDLLELFNEISSSGELTVRVYEQSQFFTLDNFKRHLALGYVQNKGNPLFKLGPLKILADGSLGARTAKLRRPYHDDATATGILIHSEEEVKHLIECAFQNDVDVAVHGIGDYTIAYVLDLIGTLREKYPRSDPRNAIVHCQIMDDALIDKMASEHVSALVQPVFLEYDMTIVKERVGKALAKTSYAYRTMLAKGIKLGFGSDAPVEDPNPFRSIYYAVHRERPDGLSYYKEEAVTLCDALKAFTTDAAYFSYEEAFKGKLQKGHFADFIVLSENLQHITPDELLNVSPRATYLGGTCVFNNTP